MFPLTVTLRHIFSTSFVLCSAAVMADGECPAVCSCAAWSGACPPGVSLVSDSCGCCRRCARQFNEDCSASQPCDHIKGLRCHLGAGGLPDRGLCRAEAHGLPCDFGGHVYQHGENFQPSCRHQCTCIDAVVGCTPLCPHLLPPPDRRCPRPRLAKAEHACCEEWLCDHDNRIGEEEEEPEEPPLSPLPDTLPPNRISNLLLVPPKFTDSFSVSEASPGSRCLAQTTAWTECSASCGMGLSSRVTNSNPDCQLMGETRLCQIRQCDPELPLATWGKRGKKCQRTVRPREPVQVSFAGCSTRRRYRPRACGSCADGRCCAPSASRTVRLRFLCADGESFSRDMMWIQRCSCSQSCRAHSRPSGPSLSLHNDIHTFRH
ncbi:CCN family member 1-like [Nerophis ophidion]|uniref:CCN family member 1-like n=1 Tax=Nerophis ophidion TaxID=159077 RepID=UPI002ADF1323|nr:CCN family member 1-like [Nerophis ophidion]